MRAWIIDAYRVNNQIVLWLKTEDKDIRLVRNFNTFIYLDLTAEAFLKKHKLQYFQVEKQNYLRQWKTVLALQVPNLTTFERFVKWIERETNHAVPLYNADISPEQLYFYENDLTPCTAVEIEENNIRCIDNNTTIPLKKLDLAITAVGDIRVTQEVPLSSIKVNGKLLQGEEKTILESFADEFRKSDPDVIVMDFAFSRMPYLVKRLAYHNISCPLNRWDEIPLIYRGGRSYYTYGSVRYQDYTVRLHGRFLVDTSTMVGSTCEIDAIIELCQLSGTFFQQLASRSFGAVFQSALVRELIRHNFLVPFKEKPIDKPLTLSEMLKADRAAHYFDPLVGYHEDVAEIDFCSMFPWLIYNHNISADTILSDKGPFEHVPGIPVRISLDHKGLVPIAIKPIIDRRMFYKKNPTAVNKQRSVGLKWVLVTSYGYLRFREFKLGIARSHMAVCAYAREIILAAATLAEEKGFVVVHGLVDSLYIKKKNINEQEVKDFCKELECITGIPVGFEGIFKWIVFLPSVVDKDRHVNATYYGTFSSGDIKARGIEIRKRGTPVIVKYFQKRVLESMANCNSSQEIIAKVPSLCKLLRTTLKKLPDLGAEMLSSSVRISKTEYKHNIPQKLAAYLLKKKGIAVYPGQSVSFVFQPKKIVLPEDYNGTPDIEYYKKLLIRSLFILLQPFGFTKDSIQDRCSSQTKLTDFSYVRHVYVPLAKDYEERQGLSERLLAKRLQKQGYQTWRGGLISIIKSDDLYPNVRKKYLKLHVLLKKYHPEKIDELHYLCDVHHGMPDFLCFRNGEFKFVECKLGHEQLSKRQKICIQKLQDMGFPVEVHKLVEACTKTRVADVNLNSGKSKVFEKQVKLTQKIISQKEEAVS